MMTKEQYIESLRKLNLKVYFMGELISNPVDHPMIRPSMNSVAMTYELAEKDEYKTLMTAKSNLTGKTVNRFCHLHQSTEDLINKVKMQRLVGQKTGLVSNAALEWTPSTPFTPPLTKLTKLMERNTTNVS